jgi:hypothetical protein
LGEDPLRRFGRPGRLRLAMLRAQMLVQLGVQNALGQRLLQVVQQPITSE